MDEFYPGILQSHVMTVKQDAGPCVFVCSCYCMHLSLSLCIICTIVQISTEIWWNMYIWLTRHVTEMMLAEACMLTVEHCGAPLCMNIKAHTGTPVPHIYVAPQSWRAGHDFNAPQGVSEVWWSAHMLCSFCTVEHWPARTLSIQIVTTVPVDDLQSGGACLAG